MVEQRQTALQRIQVGLVGLVVVLLFVSLANMVLDRVADVPSAGQASGQADNGTSNSSTLGSPAEPLAELGVTPVAIEDVEAVESGASTASQNDRRVPVSQQR